MNKGIIRKSLFVCILGIIIISCRTKSDIVNIKNSSPKYKDRYVNIELLYDMDVTQISMFSKTTDYDIERNIAFDKKDNMYILDDFESKIYVFDNNGKYIKEIGRSGQGPKEFVEPTAIMIKDDKLYVFFGYLGGEFKIFDLDGNYISHHIGTIPNRMKVKAVENKYYILSAVVDRRLTSLDLVISIYDKDWKKQKDIFRENYLPGLFGPQYEFIISRWINISRDGDIYYPENNFKACSITKYDSYGKAMLTFEKPYNIIPYSEKARERFNSLYKSEIEKKERVFPESPPVVVNMFQDNRENIWIVSGETNEDNLVPNYKNKIDIFDNKGLWLSSFDTKDISKLALYNNEKIYHVLPIDNETYVQKIEVFAVTYVN